MSQFIQSHIFLIMSLLTSSLAAVSSGIVGTYVVIKRIAFITGSLSHAILGGMGFFLYLQKLLGWDFLSASLGAFLTSIGSAYLISMGRYKWKEREDTLISIIWSFGMSIGIIFLAMTPGANADVLNYLFGNLLWSTAEDIYILLGLMMAVLLFTFKNYHNLLSLCFDEKQATLSGLNCQNLFLKLLILIGIVTVYLIKSIGAILVMSMLTIPAATACHFAKNIKHVMFYSILLGLSYAILGVCVAFYLNWPPGATITLIASLGYSLTKLGTFKKLQRFNLFPNRTKES